MIGEYIASRFFGRPTELYRFTYGPNPNDSRFYVDGERTILHAGDTYSPVPIKRGSTSNSGSLDKSTMEVSMPHTLAIPQLFRVYSPSHPVTLTVFQGENADPDAQFIAVWVGRVVSIAFEGIEAKLSCEPVSTSFRRSGLRRNYQYMCPHILYGPQCGADKIAATAATTAYAVNGRSVTLNGLLSSPDRYIGGMLEWVTPAGIAEARTILSATTVSGRSQLQLTGIASGLLPGRTVSVVRGCRHTLPACIEDHDNAPNYGGDPWIPTKNPIGNVSPY